MPILLYSKGGLNMDTKNKHMTYDNRLDIEKGLKELKVSSLLDLSSS